MHNVQIKKLHNNNVSYIIITYCKLGLIYILNSLIFLFPNTTDKLKYFDYRIDIKIMNSYHELNFSII